VSFPSSSIGGLLASDLDHWEHTVSGTHDQRDARRLRLPSQLTHWPEGRTAGYIHITALTELDIK